MSETIPEPGTTVSIGGVDWYVVKREWRMGQLSPRLTLATLDGFMRERSDPNLDDMHERETW